jgi:putative drug exporter of the RND superfamily
MQLRSQTRQSRQSHVSRLVKRGKWFTLLAWIIVLVLGFPYITKLSNSLSNTNSLPASDQAQKVANLQQKAHPNAAQEDMEVVYENKTGLTALDKQQIINQREEAIASKINNVTSVSQVAYATDGQAAYFRLLANIPNNNTGPTLEKDIVTKVRQVAHTSGDLSVSTTGAVAFDVDSGGTNGDTILLITSGIIVAALLILTYRSALLWIIPLISAMMAISLADTIVYALTRHGMQVSSLDSSILIILVFGVATDYGMLLISRYREYLHIYADKNEAVALALRGSIEAIAASATTVALALLSLVFAVFSATKDLGPVAAIGVACAFLVQMTFLPAMLAVAGRVLLWPRAPKFIPDNKNKEYDGPRLWGKVADIVSRHPRRITISMTAVLLVCTVGLTQLTLSVNPTAVLRGNPSSMQGQNVLERHFASPSDSSLVITADSMQSMQRAKQIAEENTGTGSVGAVTELAGHPSISVIPKATPYSNAAFAYIADLRAQYQRAGLQSIAVGGDQASQYDYSQIAKRDDRILMPIILVIVGIILGLLLRSIVAPILLLLTVMISFAGSFGMSVFIFQDLFHFQGMDPAFPTYIFLFVVALGVDYNIFLMDRARQEATQKGTQEGILHALRVTGGVITAAGLVLAGTFAALAQIPTVATTEIGVAIALGVIIDSFLVRSFLVPAAVLIIGKKVWWPSRLAKLK